MKDADIVRIAGWVVRRGLAGMAEEDMLREFCEKCRAAGLEISRAMALIDTLHPVHEGRVFRWRDEASNDPAMVEYGRSDEGEGATQWQTSPFFHLLQTGEEEMRVRIGFGETADFPVIQEMKDGGHTDYLVFVHRFAGDNAIGEMDCVYSSWVTRHPEGFSEAALVALRRLVPPLALAIKATALARVAGTLVDVYLGRDAGRRVLEGRIRRGVAERIEAALWFSDLRSYTAITDTAQPSEIIPLLNDYAEVVITAIHEAGGDVLKLIGDGALAVFRADDPAEACRRALRAEENLRERMKALNERRQAEERPITTAYIGLHIGEVFYGNVGSFDRLDFTVVGPAVNETSRIASMCRSVDRPLLLSSAFADALPAEERARVVSVGRFALRGVGKAQHLFTIDPELI
ncbi:MAG: adenylate/guanylate cyclase domain-containing protein [Reyranella sp.]|jgi:adenylate cyclase|nr:MAG: adenylate/guanylate cyclase domain-containing protein [Reyranella sp.]